MPTDVCEERDDSRVREAVPFDDLYATQMGATHEDLSTDYADASAAFDELAVLENGMAVPLRRFAGTLQEFGALQTRTTEQSTDAVLAQLQAILAYVSAHKNVMKHRDAKQLDFEGLTDYLSGVVSERDRLAGLAGGGASGSVRGAGIGGYMRSTMDRVFGVDEEQARIERMQRHDARIAELQEAVTAAHDQSQAFNRHVAQEHEIYEWGRQRETLQLLRRYVDGNVAMHREGLAQYDELIAQLERS